MLSIKNAGGSSQSLGVRQGFNVITKEGFPVAKLSELSWYRQEDGNDGTLEVRKYLLAPDTAKSLCLIVYQASGFVLFEYSGAVTVSKQ